MCAENFDGGWRWCGLCVAVAMFSSEFAWLQHVAEHEKKFPHAEYGHVNYAALVGGTPGFFSASSGSTLNL